MNKGNGVLRGGDIVKNRITGTVKGFALKNWKTDASFGTIIMSINR